MMNICERIENILEIIEKCKIKAGRKDNVKLIAVSKTFPADKILEVYNCGIRDFGENYVQEMIKKIDELKNYGIKWHFIGHLQRNKAKYIFDKIEYLQSLCSIKLAEILNRKLETKGLKLKVLVQVNIGKDKNKHGIYEEELEDFLIELQKFKNLIIKGLMCIPPLSIDREITRKYYRKMRELFEKYKDNFQFEELSMGMSGDFDIAVEEGATMVRIGTLIFGQRS